MGPRRGRAGARRRRLVARGGVRAARTRHQASASGQPHPRARAGAGRSVRRRVLPVAWEAIGEVLPRAGLLVNTTSLGMHGQPALEIDVARLPPHGGGRRSRLCAAGNAVAGGRASARTAGRRRAWDAAAPGGARLRALVRAAAGSHLRNFVRWSRPISQKLELPNTAAAPGSFGRIAPTGAVRLARSALGPRSSIACRRDGVRYIAMCARPAATDATRIRGTIESVDGAMLDDQIARGRPT